MAEIARKHGYATGAIIGGVTLQDKACGLSRGFDLYDDQFALDPADMKRPAREVTEAAVRWMDAQEQPFFLFVHYFDAHFPYTPPSPWDRAYDPDYRGALDGSDATLRPYRDGERTPSPRDVAHIEALYAGEVSALDQELAPLLAALPSDAVVVITADHGESFGHDYWFNHRGVLWDDVMQVPLVIRGLSREPGSVETGDVGLVDVARTVLGAAGLPADTRMNGRDLGRVDPSASSVPQLAITDPWVGSAWFAARWQGHKRIDRPGATGMEWYELAADPKEQHPQVLPSEHRLQSARDRWTEAVAAHAGDQVEAPVRSIPDDEVQRLEALGYVDPTRSAPGPGGPAGPSPAARPGGRMPGKAPGMRRGPPGGAQPPPSGG
jgi:arylsulfatase A-like enzyme